MSTPESSPSLFTKLTSLKALLYTILFFEGYVVLSSELLAIRQLLPFTGSGTDTVAIIIGAVLVPLALGYYQGGKFKPTATKRIRSKLLFNFLIAMVFLTPGLSYIFISDFMVRLNMIGLEDRYTQTAIYTLVFLICPIYLLGQTVPLLSHFFKHHSHNQMAESTGKILLFSTLGSFGGAIITTLVIMPKFGVDAAVSLNMIILMTLIFLLGKDGQRKHIKKAICITLFALLINSGFILRGADIYVNTPYNTIKVKEKDGDRLLALNHAYSSLYTHDGRKFPYIEYVEEISFAGRPESRPPLDLLVLGTGGFTFGAENTLDNFDYVDIDKELKAIAEEKILQKKLTPNKHFHALPARAFIAQTDKKYDVIFIDAYTSKYNIIPGYLATQEFFQSVKDLLKEDGTVIANMIISPKYDTDLSRNLDATFRSVFPFALVNFMSEAQGLNYENYRANGMYVYRHVPNRPQPSIYIDQHESSAFDN